MSAIATLLPRLRTERPLVHAVTNPVTQLFVADALNAVSARPIMATGRDEIAEVSAKAASLLINIGVPQSAEPYAAAITGAKSDKNAKGRGWVFDPVGAGASRLRNQIAASLLASKPGPAIIRANAGEVLALAGQAGLVEGVDSLASAEEAAGVAKILAEKHGAVVALTGATDFVVSGSRVVRLTGGDPMMARVTGMGCVASALCAAFLAVADDPFDAAVAALHLMSGAGDHAAATTKGPGSFRTAFLDALHAAAA